RSLGADDPRTLDQRRVDLAHQLLQGTVTVTDVETIRAAVTQILAPHPADTTSTAGAADTAGAVRTAGATGTAGQDAGAAGAAGAGGGIGRVDQVAGAAGYVSPPAEILAEIVAAVLAARPDPGTAVGRKPLIQVVVSLDTLLGDDRPGELVGHGPIPATTARALAAGGTWTRLVIDPLSGAVRDRGRSTYTPPEDMADLIRARDGLCRGPLCSRPIRDLDHFVPWAQGGTTDTTNLHGLCLHHHKLKDAPGWQVLAAADGSLTWISPCGHRETTHPHDYRPHLGDTGTTLRSSTSRTATTGDGEAERSGDSGRSETTGDGGDDVPPF
ncbi:HNH endonuclease signature motif containing protein, partial [Pseudonocardia sp. NPDC046786]|uniref:HNH endonuclease signature motif containing protein n=1 Tax=Pseudonocardia sp. NPDC046786 TaxID=3155471 RepID=UPI003407E1CB